MLVEVGFYDVYPGVRSTMCTVRFCGENLGFVGNYRVFRGFRYQLGLGIDPSRECIGIAGDHREKTPDLR